MSQDRAWRPAGAGARIISPRGGYPGVWPISRSLIVIDRQFPTMTSGTSPPEVLLRLRTRVVTDQEQA